MRLIDIEPFEKNGDCEIHYGYKNNEVSAIDSKDIPTVEPKHGKWEWKSTHKLGLDYGGTGYIPNFKCSVCECITESYIRFDEPHEIDADYPNFCPNCGADMRGEDND